MAFIKWASPGPRHILIQDTLESCRIGDIERVVGMTSNGSRVIADSLVTLQCFSGRLPLISTHTISCPVACRYLGRVLEQANALVLKCSRN
jgi:hypothetical protein